MFAIKRCLTYGIRAGQKALTYKGKHTLPNLPYEYNALEPVICCEIMELHHQKHHAGYVNGLNDAEEKIKEAAGKSDFATIIQLGDALRFNGGGHINHTLFWENLTPCPEQPSEELMCCICQDFESMDKLREELQNAAIGIQGSGWAWLGYRKFPGRLEIAKCAKQDPLQPTTGLIPLLGIDVWEHAYYIQYKNVRAEYVKNLWQIINWKTVSERLTKAKQADKCAK